MKTAGANRIRRDIRDEVLKQRYLLKDPQGHIIETPDQMYDRVATAIAQVECRYGLSERDMQFLIHTYRQLMADGRFLPNSPTLMNAGHTNGLLSACFVLPVNDSVEEIFDTVKDTALIQKAGGGTGFAFDRLRPTGDIVASSGGRTSGPISFWRAIAEASNAIQQGAHRRGANMAMMSVEHPDILKFIAAKKDPSVFTNFNISVKITDRFMTTLRKHSDTPHVVVNPRTNEPFIIPRALDLKGYGIQDLRPVHADRGDCYSVQDIWKMIIHHAHATGEPGMCFIDRINADNPTPQAGSIAATNPCGEQPLLDYEACTLGSLNIARYVRLDGSDLDWQSLGEDAEFAVRFLDDVIHANYWPNPKIEETTLANRKIGLGQMGVADAMILRGIRYDSEQAVEFADCVSRFIQEHAYQASQALARQRGCFPNYAGSVYAARNVLMRNATCTTIAPTGGISIIAGCSSGIEPVFRFSFRRRALDGAEFLQLHPLLEDLGTEQGWLNHRVRTALADGASPREIDDIPRDLADVLVTAHEIDPQWHVRVQAAFQANVDNSVSKTVNLAADATVETVDEIFQLAYHLGCKGVTVYRDGSRDKQVLSAIETPPKSMDAVSRPRVRPNTTTGKTRKFRMGCGTLFVTVNRDEQGICEVFANLGKQGGCQSQTEATCRAVSVAIRSGVAPAVMIDQLQGIRCLSAAVAKKSNKAVDVLSCPDAIARALAEAADSQRMDRESPFRRTCEECGQPMRWEANCTVCDFCGHSSCG